MAVKYRVFVSNGTAPDAIEAHNQALADWLTIMQLNFYFEIMLHSRVALNMCVIDTVHYQDDIVIPLDEDESSIK